jgi:midasin (ATPase involved in ribosome maturation)
MQGSTMSMAKNLSVQYFAISKILNVCLEAKQSENSIHEFSCSVKNLDVIDEFLHNFKNAAKRAELLEGFRNTNFENFNFLVQMLKKVRNGSLGMDVFQNRLQSDPRFEIFRARFETVAIFTEEEKTNFDSECILGAKRIILEFQALMKKYDTIQADESHNYFRNQKECLKQISNFSHKTLRQFKSFKAFSSKAKSFHKLIPLILEVVKTHTINWLYKYTKFTYFTMTVFHNILYKGFCATEEEEQEQKQGQDEYDFGTGVGEGQGDNDATENYEFEE